MEFLLKYIMPKFFCEYCGIYLTHSSPHGRKQHVKGKKHIANKIEYFSQFLLNFQRQIQSGKYIITLGQAQLPGMPSFPQINPPMMPTGAPPSMTPPGMIPSMPPMPPMGIGPSIIPYGVPPPPPGPEPNTRLVDE